MPFGFILGGALGAVGSLIGGSQQADAQQQAADTQLQMFNTINQQEQPFIQGGYGAEDALQYGLGLNRNPGGSSGSVSLNSLMSGGPAGINGIRIPGGSSSKYTPPTGLGFGSLTSQFTPQDYLNNQDPGYQFALQTGGQALRNQDTPGVGALSGPALKDLMSFNVGTANQYYQNAFNRFTTQQNNIFSRLSQIAGLGQNAATQTGNAGANLGSGIAQAQAAAGGSTAAGTVGATNSLGNAITLPLLLKGLGGGGGGSGSAGMFGSILGGSD